MNNTEIHLTRKLAMQLLHLAQISPNEEICGLISGSCDALTTCYPINNVANHPQKRFQLDPQQQINAMVKMRDSNEQLMAVFHSHPSAPAEPSIVDLEMADDPSLIHLIISLNTKGILEMRGYRIHDNQATEVGLQMSE